jgi:hypothetical protein
MYKTWKVRKSSLEIAKEKATRLREIYRNAGFGENCHVVQCNQSYEDGFTGEEELCNLMDEERVSYVYLNKVLKPNAEPDNGDFIINNQLVNLKTQLYKNGSPNEEWFANINEKDFISDQEIGIEAYHFIFYCRSEAEMFYGGYCSACDISRIGRLVQKGEKVTSGFTASETMYAIPLYRLRALIPDTYQRHDSLPF